MTYVGNRNFALEVALGKVSGYHRINKFGQASDCDKDVPTDVWNGVIGTPIWVAPSEARIHDIVSSDANDSGPSGTGLRSVRIFGLTDWGTPEVNEDLVVNGTTSVPTASSYVIIHRIVGRTFGSGGTNAGIVKATAQADGTITAVIPAGEGQTLMTIYGIASSQKIVLERLVCTVLGGGGGEAVNVAGTLLVRERVDQADSGYVTKERFAFNSLSPQNRDFFPTLAFDGPCIVKVQVKSDTNNSVVTAVFDASVVDV